MGLDGDMGPHGEMGLHEDMGPYRAMGPHGDMVPDWEDYPGDYAMNKRLTSFHGKPKQKPKTQRKKQPKNRAGAQRGHKNLRVQPHRGYNSKNRKNSKTDYIPPRPNYGKERAYQEKLKEEEQKRLWKDWDDFDDIHEDWPEDDEHDEDK